MGITKTRARQAIDKAARDVDEQAALHFFVDHLPDDETSPLAGDSLADSRPDEFIVAYLRTALQKSKETAGAAAAGPSSAVAAADVNAFADAVIRRLGQLQSRRGNGSTAGGSTAGGSTAGGSTAGGSAAGAGTAQNAGGGVSLNASAGGSGAGGGSAAVSTPSTLPDTPPAPPLGNFVSSGEPSGVATAPQGGDERRLSLEDELRALSR